MKNFVQPGDSITLPAPADVTSGGIVIAGALVGVAAADALTGEGVAIATRGVLDLPKGAEVFAVGDEVEEAAGAVAALDSGTRVGIVVAAAASGDTTARVMLG